MHFDPSKLDSKETYKLLCATVTPRPIAWVVSTNPEGRLNAAPFSFFNVFSPDPPVVGLGIAPRENGKPKDSFRNIMDNKEFTINLVSYEMAPQMNVTAIEFEPEISEVEQAKLVTLPSTKVKPPRIQGAPVSFECELFKTVELSETRSLVLGRVVLIHVADKFVLDGEKHYVDTPNMGLVGRMHGAGWYARTTDLFKIDRIPVANWAGPETL